MTVLGSSYLQGLPCLYPMYAHPAYLSLPKRHKLFYFTLQAQRTPNTSSCGSIIIAFRNVVNKHKPETTNVQYNALNT